MIALSHRDRLRNQLSSGEDVDTPPAEEEYDAISIEGVPSLHMKLTPCIHGDVGTVAMVVNSIAKMQGPTGLGYHERLTYSFGRA